MRLIAFGCSFTDYCWPTWSDIIAEDLQCDYENWGIGGSGNQCIARRVLYKQSRGFDPDDWVMIQWSSINREDRYIRGFWRAEGSVALSPTYRGEFLAQHWDWDNDVINTAHSRITTEQLLGPRLRYQMSMRWNDLPSDLLEKSAITDYWRSRLTAVDNLPTGAQSFRVRVDDTHPSPQWWLNWVEQRIYPRFGFALRPQTRERVQDLQRYLETLVEQGCPRDRLQKLASQETRRQGWRLMKVKPGSDTLTPGQGTDVLM